VAGDVTGQHCEQMHRVRMARALAGLDLKPFAVRGLQKGGGSERLGQGVWEVRSAKRLYHDGIGRLKQNAAVRYVQVKRTGGVSRHGLGAGVGVLKALQRGRRGDFKWWDVMTSG
jgi:hypothetical protein